MARKPAAAAPVLSKKDVEACLRRNEVLNATELAKKLVDATPTEEHQKLYLDTLKTAFDSYTAQGKVKAVLEMLKAAAEFAQIHPTAAEDAAVLHAKAGEFAKATQLSNTPRVNYHIADLCLRRGKADGAGDSIKTDLAAIQNAFKEYEAGRDEAAREASATLGLTSAFLQWRLVLRGLIAYTNGDNARALENWQRLNVEFLPAKVVAVLRATIDTGFRESQSVAMQTELNQKAAGLTSTELTKQLRAIQKYTSQGESLSGVWPHVTAAGAQFKQQQPKLWARLGQILYHAIMRQGQPSDLKNYRLAFGVPPDDPEFHKLEALILEGMDELESAVHHWKKYEAWLATKPSGWPADVLGLARATILRRIGEMLQDLRDDAEQNELDDFDDEHEGSRSPYDIISTLFRQKKKSPGTTENPMKYFQQAVELAPNWTRGTHELMEQHMLSGNSSLAAQLGESFLQRNPTNLTILSQVAQAYSQQDDHVNHLATLKKAQIINPLDVELNRAAALAYVAVTRMFLLSGDLKQCEQYLNEGQQLLEKTLPASVGAIRVLLLRRQGKAEESQELESRIVAETATGWMQAIYMIAILGQLVKLKPAVRKPAEDRLKAMFATALPSAAEVASLYQGFEKLSQEGVEYRGQAAHEKKILALLERSIKTAGVVEDYEKLAALLAVRQQGKLLKKVGPLFSRQFPQCPTFYISQIQGIIMTSKDPFRERYRIAQLIDKAERAVSSSDNPRYQGMSEVLNELKNRFSVSTGFPFFG